MLIRPPRCSTSKSSSPSKFNSDLYSELDMLLEFKGILIKLSFTPDSHCAFHTLSEAGTLAGTSALSSHPASCECDRGKISNMRSLRFIVAYIVMRCCLFYRCQFTSDTVYDANREANISRTSTCVTFLTVAFADIYADTHLWVLLTNKLTKAFITHFVYTGENLRPARSYPVSLFIP